MTLMSLPLNWNAASMSVVTVSRTLGGLYRQWQHRLPLTWGNIISLPFTTFSYFFPALYLLTAAQSDPNMQYQEKLQSLGPWDYIPSGLTAVMRGIPQSFQGIDPFSATAKQACRSMPQRQLLSHPWRPFLVNSWGQYTNTAPSPHTMPLNRTKQKTLMKMIQKLMMRQ